MIPISTECTIREGQQRKDGKGSKQTGQSTYTHHGRIAVMTTSKTPRANVRNLCAKTRPKDNPYEVWQSPDGSWTWNVLKKWQVDDNKPFARWFCFVTSPFCPGGEYGDTYVRDIQAQARQVVIDPETVL